MKRLIASLIIAISLGGIAHAAFGIFQTYTPGAVANPNLRQGNFFGINETDWQNFTGNYTPGLGNPAVSTDDYYHQNGLSGFRPYDLLDPTFTGACATVGTSIAASRGRYAWLLAPDHGNGADIAWLDSANFRIGYSNDPGVPPSRMETIYVAGTLTSAPVISTITASISDGGGVLAGNKLIVTAYTGIITNDGSAKVSGAGVTTATISSQSTGTSGQIGTYNIGGAAQLVASQTMTVSQTNYQIYYDASLTCNPDDATTPFWIYAEGQASAVQHEMGVIKSADLLTWTSPQPTHNALNFGTWSSFQRINRIGTGNWESKGYEVGYPYNGNVFARSTWTSTNGLDWAAGTTNLNTCIPASSQSGTTTSCTGSARSIQFAQSPYTVTIGGTPWVIGAISTVNGTTRAGSQWAGRVAVDGNQSVIDTPTATNISNAYAGNYPGPTYLQTVTGYVEDGIAHYYAVKGWAISNGLWFVTSYAPYSNNGQCKALAPVNGNEGYFSFTAKIDNGAGGSGNILNVTAIASGSILVGSQIFGGIPSNSGTNGIITAQLTGSAGGIGTYQMGGNFNVASTSAFFGSACGGLWQQNMDYLTEVVDATAAAGAAPVGVRASCAASTATINWYTGVLPTDTMRLYRGTTAGSQTTLVGDFSGGTATDTGMTLNAVTYYKLVYLNGGTEQKNRVVSTYCSTSSAFVNAHRTRALAGGADSTTCNGTMMDSFDSWLTSNSRMNNLQFATMADFCVAKSGSNISKIFDMGTTRLPRGGDYTPTTPASTTYNATGINGKPAWVNGTNTAQGYYGGGQVNNIRRKTQITLFSAYQKPGTAVFTPLAWGEVGGMKMTHTAGSPGTISCQLYDATTSATATKAVSGLATDVHTAACTYDAVNGLVAWSDASPGTAVTTLVIPSPNLNPPDALTGRVGQTGVDTPFLGSGSALSKYRPTTNAYIFSNNDALASVRANMVLDVALPQAEMTTLDALVR